MTADTAPSYLPVRVDQSPFESRLLTSLSELPQIITRIENEEKREGNMRKLQESLFSVSPFELDAAVIDERTRLMLEPEETVKPNWSKEAQSRMEDTMRDFALGIKKEESAEGRSLSTKQFTQRLIVLLHDDTDDPIIKQLFTKDERTLLYSQAVEATDNNNLKTAQRLYVKIIPKYYQELVNHFRVKGLYLQQIAEAYPNLLPDLELARYLAHANIPQQAEAKTLENTKTTDEINELILKKKKRYARGNGFLSLIHSADRMITYCEKRNLDSRLLEALNNMKKQMMPIGFTFGMVAYYEELHDLSSGEQSSDLGILIDETLTGLPLEFLRAAHVLGSNPASAEQIISQLTKTLETLSTRVQAYHRELHVVPTESSQISQSLKSRLEEALGGEEEKFLPGGVRIRVAKEPKGKIWDTHIQWHEYAADNPSFTTNHQYDYILIEGNWWFRYSTSRTWWNRDGFHFIVPSWSPTFDNTYSDYFSVLLGFSGGKKGNKLQTFPESELVKEVKKYNFSFASPESLRMAFNKIQTKADNSI